MLGVLASLGDAIRRDVVVERPLAPGRRARRARPRGTSPSSRRSTDPTAAVRRAHELGEPVLVTGSLYLLADLEAADSAMKRRSRMRERIAVLTFALVVLVAIVGIAFAAGYILGKLLL